MAAAAPLLDLALPHLRLVAPDVPPALAAQIERGLSKFARNSSTPSFTITVVSHGSSDLTAAAELRAQANIWYQFVVGHEHARGAAYTTADGSIAQIDFASCQLTLQPTAGVFTAPYSTWSDLLSAPLASAWRFHGLFPLHAAAVSFDAETVLVIGGSGAGKTSTALALVEGGGCWRADDKVLVREEAGRLVAVSLYANTNLPPATIAAYPSLQFTLHRAPIDPTNDKRPCMLDELNRRVDLRPFAPTALLFIEQAPRADSRWERLSETEALLLLSAQSPAGAARPFVSAQHAQLVAMARRLPAWRLEAGRDALDRPRVFASRLCEHLAGRPA